MSDKAKPETKSKAPSVQTLQRKIATLKKEVAKLEEAAEWYRQRWADCCEESQIVAGQVGAIDSIAADASEWECGEARGRLLAIRQIARNIDAERTD